MRAESKPAKSALRVVFDSNALLVPLKFRIDIFEELKTLLNVNFEPILLSPIRQELEKLAITGSPQMRKEAAYALKLAEKCRSVKLDKGGEVPPDNVIIQFASKCRCPVFTNDRQLRKKLRDINVPVIYVRQKSRLEIDGRL